MKRIEIEIDMDLPEDSAKLVFAALDLLAMEGHTALSEDKVLLASGLTEKELSKYFGNIASLKEYCQSSLFQLIKKKKMVLGFALKEGEQFGFDLVAEYLDRILFELCHNLMLRNLVLWSLVERGHILDSIRLCWDTLQEDLFRHGETFFKSPAIDFKMSMLQNIGGMLYLFLRETSAADMGSESMDNWDNMVKVSQQMRMQIKTMFIEDRAFKERTGLA